MTDEAAKELDEWLRKAGEGVIPKIQDSHFVLGIMRTGTDAAQCLQIGAAILLEKPIILLRLAGARIPHRLMRLSDAVIEIDEGGLNDPANRAKVQAAIMTAIKKLNHARG